MNIFKKIKDVHQKHKEAMKRVPLEEVLDIIKENNGRITATGLARQTELTYMQASLKLQALYDKGYLKIIYSSNGLTQIMVLKEAEFPAANTLIGAQNQTKLTDARVLKATVEAGGKITPAALCMALDCSIDEARRKLDKLQLKDVYDLEVTEHGSILYVLNDMECFQDSKIKKIS